MSSPQVDEVPSTYDGAADTTLQCALLSFNLNGTDIKLDITLKPEQEIPKALSDLLGAGNAVNCSMTQGSISQKNVSQNCTDCGSPTSQTRGQICLKLNIAPKCLQCSGEPLKENDIGGEHDETGPDVCDDEELDEEEEAKNVSQEDTEELQEHVEPVGNKWKCKHCGHLLFSWNISRHVKTHNDEYWDKYKCNICQKQFTKNSHLQMHVKTHSVSAEKFPCGTCGKYFKSVRLLRRHRKNDHTTVDTAGLISQTTGKNLISDETKDKNEVSPRVILHRTRSTVRPRQNKIIAELLSRKRRTSVKSMEADRPNKASSKFSYVGKRKHSTSVRTEVQHEKGSKGIPEKKWSSLRKNEKRKDLETENQNETGSLDTQEKESSSPSKSAKRKLKNFETEDHNATNSQDTPEKKLDSPKKSAKSNLEDDEAEDKKENSSQASPQNKSDTPGKNVNDNMKDVDVEDQNEESSAATLENKESLTEYNTRMESENAQMTDHNPKDSQRPTAQKRRFTGRSRRTEYVNADYIESEKGYKCKFCKQIFAVHHIYRHLKTHKQGYFERYKCRICHRQFTKNSHLEKHVKTHFLSSKGKHPCSSCGKFFVSKEYLKLHLEHHHQEGSTGKESDDQSDDDSQREECPERIKGPEVILRDDCHGVSKKTKDSGQVNCPEGCEYIENKNMYKCNDCGDLYFVQNISRHLKTHKQGYYDKYKCTICQRQFTKNSHLQMHIGTHSIGKEKFPCGACGEYFPSVKMLRDHRKDVHLVKQTSKPGETESVPKQHTAAKVSEGSLPQCPVCFIIFVTNEHLQKHLERHGVLKKELLDWKPESQNPEVDALVCPQGAEYIQSQNQYKCKSCGEFFPVQNISRHVKTHEEGYWDKYKCKICERQFKKSSHLQMHIRAHSNKVKMSCVQCGIVFPNVTLLVEHRNDKHPGLQSSSAEAGQAEDEGCLYQCPACSKGFVSRAELEKHMEEHTVEEQMVFKDLYPESKGNEAESETNVAPVDKNNDVTALLLELTNRTKQVESGQNKNELGDTEVHLEENIEQGSSNSPSELFKCSVCERRFKDRRKGKQHEREHSNDCEYKCDLCDKSFVASCRLEAHRLTHIPKLQGKHECHICKKRFKVLWDLRKHIKNIHKMETASCSKCSSYFMSRDLLLDHICTQEYVCSVCTSTHPNEAARKEHMKIHSKLECYICQKRFLKEHGLNNHLLTHHEHKRSPCDICGKLITKRYMEIHVKMHSNTKEAICDLCGVKFLDRSSLHKHQQTSHSDKPYLCPKCGKGCSTETSLCQHLASWCGNPEDRQKCDVCGKTVASAEKLQKHMLIHTGERSYMCDHCGKCFASNTALVSHMKVHENYRPHQCDICGHRFRNVWHMRNHRKIHTGEGLLQCPDCLDWFVDPCYLNNQHKRKYCKARKVQVCQLCNRKFANMKILKTHHEFHAGLRPFECSKCGMAFAKQTSLSDHCKNHVEPISVWCKICKKGFKRATQLRKHERLHKNSNQELNRYTLSSDLKPKQVSTEDVIVTDQQELDHATVVLSAEEVTEQEIQILQDAIKQEPQALDLKELVSTVERRLQAPPLIFSSSVSTEETIDISTLPLAVAEELKGSREVQLLANGEIIIVTVNDPSV